MSQSWNRSSRVFRDLINIYWCATPRPGLHTVHFFCEIHFNGNSFLQLHTSQTWEFELTECLEIYDDPHDINNCWLFDASVKGVEKVEKLAIPYWLTTAPPSAGAINWLPLLHKSILFKPPRPNLHPIQLLCQLEITCLNQIECNLAPPKLLSWQSTVDMHVFGNSVWIRICGRRHLSL